MPKRKQRLQGASKCPQNLRTSESKTGDPVVHLYEKGPNAIDTHFDELQDVFLMNSKDPKNPVVYGVFTTSSNIFKGSAVCMYSMTDVRRVFLGPYAHQDGPNYQWVPYQGQVPYPRPGTCPSKTFGGFDSTKDLPDEVTTFARSHPAMYNPVPINNRPIMIKTDMDYQFTQIVVDRVDAEDGQYDVMSLLDAKTSTPPNTEAQTTEARIHIVASNLEEAFNTIFGNCSTNAEQPQLSQPVFIGEVLQASDHLGGPPLDSLQQVQVLLMLGAPELDAVLQVGSPKSGVEGENHLPRLLVTLLLMRPRRRLAFWAASTRCQVMLSFTSANTPESFSAGLLSLHSPPSLYLCLGLPQPMWQDLALGLVELHEVLTGPPLKLVKVPLGSIPFLQRVHCITQLCVVGKLAEGALNPTVHVTDKDVKQCRSQYRPLRNTTRHWSPLGHQAVDHNSLSASIQPVPHPPSGPSVKSMSLQFRDKDVMQDSVKCFAQVQADDISCSSLIHQRCNAVVEGHQICQAQFALSEVWQGLQKLSRKRPKGSSRRWLRNA
ncbi:hypothetical protein QYF61_014951 [Mycteria americana]|uniref:Sema domain-containing protein n=1 Tax=Mycteria americana TaxID=33587 RepID=A0AAN7NDP6_MYCAM|nr:hypothetical protein QYF61_014951 [Mycteria americana]